MELAMQIISSDKTKRNDTGQDVKEFNSQSLATQAKKGVDLSGGDLSDQVNDNIQ